MGEFREAFYYRDGYYLLPDKFESVSDLVSSTFFPSTFKLNILLEDNGIRSLFSQKGICIAPCFYKDYKLHEVELTVEDAADIYPVRVELLSQSEYNARLREVIGNVCPGCTRYTPLTKRDSSLKGHYEEVSLNSVCFYRQETKEPPQVFYYNMIRLFESWHKQDPSTVPADIILKSMKIALDLEFKGEKDPSDASKLNITFEPDFFIGVLTDHLENCLEKMLRSTNFRLVYDHEFTVSKDLIESILKEENLPNVKERCIKHGVAIAVLDYDTAKSRQVENSILNLERYLCVRNLYQEPGKTVLMLLDERGVLKALNYRSPLFENANAVVTVYGQTGVNKYKMSYDMKKI